MSVAGSIYGALQRFGRPMVLRRTTTGPGGIQIPLEVTVNGTARTYRPNELVNGITQADREVTMANAEIAAAQWPGPPRRNDKLVIDGKTMNIEAVDPKYLGTEILVYICQVRG